MCASGEVLPHSGTASFSWAVLALLGPRRPESESKQKL